MKEKLREGLGETGTFAGYHPAVNFIFFVFAIGITMFSMDPLFLAVTLTASWAWSILLSGRRAIRFNLLITVPILLITSVFLLITNIALGTALTRQSQKAMKTQIDERMLDVVKTAAAMLDGDVLDGRLNQAKLRLVLAWLTIHYDDLQANWRVMTNGDEVFRIEPLR